MSVTFHLYKLCDNIHYLGRKYDFATKDEKKRFNHLYYLASISKEDDDWVDDFIKERYSDNLNHNYIEVTCFKKLSKMGSRYKGYYRLYRKLQNFNMDIISSTYGVTYKFIVVDKVVYRQGWFLKKKFFKKGTTCFIATNKKEMQNFFNKYLDFKDKRGIETYNTFLNKWEDGMIFEVSW